MDLLSTMNHQVSVLTRTQTVASSGVTTQVYTTAAVRVPCRIRELSGSEGVRYGRTTERALYEAVFLPALSASNLSRIQFGTRVFEVLGVEPEHGIDGEVEYYRVTLEETT